MIDSQRTWRSPPPAWLRSRWAGAATSLLLVLCLALAACAGSPPPQLLHLDSAWAGEAPATPSTAGMPSVQLMLPVRVPDYLDRSAVLLPDAAGTLQAAAGWRWSESLAEAVPRVLRADLAELLGPGRLWTAPLPPGLAPQRQWRVELQALELDRSSRQLRLQASWSLAEAQGTVAPRAGQLRLSLPLEGEAAAGPAALVRAHRIALRQLAESMVQSLAAPRP